MSPSPAPKGRAEHPVALESINQPRRSLALTAAAIAGAATGMLGGTRSANAAMAVFDSSVFAQAVQQVKNGAEAVSELQKQLSQLQSLASVTGVRGSAPSGSGLSRSLRTVQAAVRPPKLDFRAWHLPKEMQQTSFSSVGIGREFVNRSLLPTPDKQGNIAYASRDDAQNRRIVAEREAALTGYAVALNQHESFDGSFDRAADLADRANSAQTMMEQQRATNDLLAALLSEIVQLRAVLASQLEIQATGAIRQMPMLVTGSAPSGVRLIPTANGRLGE